MERTNYQSLGHGFYLVRTQAGFRKACKEFWNEPGNPPRIFGHPKQYPALVSLATGYDGGHYVNANCIPVNDLKGVIADA